MGMPIDKAALSAGIKPATLRQWMAESEDIAMQVVEAEAVCESELLTVLQNAVQGQDLKLAVTTSQWMLERINPSAWGRTSRNDQYAKDQKVKALAEELKAEGLEITEADVRKELAEMERKALSDGG